MDTSLRFSLFWFLFFVFVFVFVFLVLRKYSLKHLPVSCYELYHISIVHVAYKGKKCVHSVRRKGQNN